jgi:hypothetical protein
MPGRGGVFAMTRTIFLAAVLAGCAGSYQAAHIPQYEADLYPLSETKAGITIGIDEINRPERAQRYFGADLTAQGIVPVLVAVSNHGQRRVVVKPSDVLLHRGKEIVDPLPLQSVAAAAKRQNEKFFANLAFKETVLSPNETYRGVVFFAAPRATGPVERLLSALSGSREGRARIRVGLTSVDTGERVLFGPFSLAFSDSGAVLTSASH